MKKNICIILILILTVTENYSQSAPTVDENIPFLMTFGADGNSSWGDINFCQIFYCLIPSSQIDPVYIRVYDPDTGGAYDEAKGIFNTIVNYSVYGGKGCWLDTIAPDIGKENYRNGYLMSLMSFGADPKYDKTWYSFGPFNPSEGEYVEKLGGRVFKIIAEGLSGDDGNLYKYFLSTSPKENIAVEGGNFFTYEYHFRLWDEVDQVSQIYPFADDKTISIQVSNFDWDNDGIIRIFSVAKNGVLCDVSGDDEWVVREFPIVAEERNSTLEIQFIKNKTTQVNNNNVVISVKNQYGISLPFYVVPLGGIPVYTPKIRMK